MKIIFFILFIGLGFIAPAQAQGRPGDDKAPIRTDSTATWTNRADSAAQAIQDITTAYNNMEEGLDLMYEKVKKELKEKIELLNQQAGELQDQIEIMKAVLAKLKKELEKIEQQQKQAIASVKDQKKKAIQQANELRNQKRTRDLHKYSLTIKTQTQKDGEDSIKSIRSRYPINPEKDLAEKLANELKKIGISTDFDKLKEINDAITKGGQGAMAIAMAVVSAIAEIEVQRQPLGNDPKRKSAISEKQYQELIRSTGKGRDTSLWISQYLREKLRQLKK